VPVDVIQQRLCHLFDLNMHDTLNSMYTYIATYTSARALRSRVLRSGVPLGLLASAYVSIRRRMLRVTLRSRVLRSGVPLRLLAAYVSIRQHPQTYALVSLLVY
jgi:hypothetical protein